jgi:phosphoglycolate phosphatase
MDNTLYDWVGYFVPAVEAMLKQAAKVLEASDEVLRKDLRLVHVTYGNTEHPFALLETKTVQERLPTETPAERYRFLETAFMAFNAERAAHLKLYPTVHETLQMVRDRGCLVVGHTEATDVNISSRIRRLGLSELLEAIYAPSFQGPPHPLGNPSRPSANRISLRRLSTAARKPAPEIVTRILSEMGVGAQRTLYVGDSLDKDIRMAKDAGVWTAWARYGIRHDPEVWRSLVSLSHWQAAAVTAAEHSHTPKREVDPDVILDSFGEILQKFSFRKPEEIVE